MQRRGFIALLAGAGVWPIAARAQRRLPVVGFLGATNATDWAGLVAGFTKGLGEAGYTDGQNCIVDYRWAEGVYELMPRLALDLVRRPVDVIAATGGTRSIQSAKTATSRIPIVFVTGSDPIQLGLVSNLDRPSGNLTGVMFFDSVHGAKRIEILKELMPDTRVIAGLFNPNNPIATAGIADSLQAAREAGVQLDVLHASDEREIELAFAAIAERRIPGVVVHADPFLLGARRKIVDLVTRAGIAAVYGMREFAEAGGIVSYGTNIVDVFRLCGRYTGRILKGERVADLPVQQAKMGELVVNLGRARAQGVTIPAAVLAKADQVIG